MSTNIYSEPAINQLAEAASEIARRPADAAKEIAQRANIAGKEVTHFVEEFTQKVTDMTKDTVNRAAETATETYQSVAMKAEETLATSKEYVRRNPVPVVLGAVAFGVALGYLLMMARRKPTFGERYADEPLVAVRDAILGTLAPVAQRVHKGYESARDVAGKAIDQVHHCSAGRAGESLLGQIGRANNNLKFW